MSQIGLFGELGAGTGAAEESGENFQLDTVTQNQQTMLIKIQTFPGEGRMQLECDHNGRARKLVASRHSQPEEGPCPSIRIYFLLWLALMLQGFVWWKIKLLSLSTIPIDTI